MDWRERRWLTGMQPMVKVGNSLGFVFEGETVGSYAFVPEECLIFKVDGGIGVDEIEYFASGWGQRNSRFNVIETSGTHLFPVISKWVTDPDWPTARVFVDRLQEAYADKV